MHGTLERALAPAAPPATWTAALVRERLVEAFELEARIPGHIGPGRLRSTWLPAPLDSFADRVHQGSAPRAELYERWAYAAGLTPDEITRMEAAFDWSRRFLLPAHVLEAKDLNLWAWARAYRRPLRRILCARGFKPTGFYRHVDAAAARIATALALLGE